MDDEKKDMPEVQEEPVAAPKLKIICRLQEGAYTEQLVTEEPAQAGGDDAKALLHAFAPEKLIRDITEACGEGSVVVFRTDSRQMEEFRSLLTEHDVSDM